MSEYVLLYVQPLQTCMVILTIINVCKNAHKSQIFMLIIQQDCVFQTVHSQSLLLLTD